VLVRMPAGVGTLIKQKSKHNWGFWSEPEPAMDGRRMWHPRGKGLGGSFGDQRDGHTRPCARL